MGWKERMGTALTAAELIEALKELPPETIIKDSSYGSWSMGYDTLEYGFSGVSESGHLEHGKTLRAYDSWGSYDEEEG